MVKTAEKRIHRTCLVFPEERLGAAGNSTGQTGTFPLLKQDQKRNGNGQNDLNNTNNNIQSFH